MKKAIVIVSSLLVFIDQLIKYVVINNLEIYKSIKVIPNFFYITYVKNDGGAFSIFSGGRWFFIAAGLICLIFIIRIIVKDKLITKFDLFTYSLLIGGILGNVIDRVFYSSVVDYLDFYILKYDAPIFNFADICIVVGVFMMLYKILKGDNYENSNSR